MKVTLIRHTKVALPEGTCYGWSDVALADTFEQEAAATKHNLQKNLPFDAIFSSPLTRARRLAAYCGYPTPTLDDRLKEINMGEWEMRRYDDIEREDPHILAWYEDYMHLEATGGESFPMLYRRVAAFLDQLKTRSYNRVAVFSHGGVLICAGIYGGLFTKENAFENLVPFGGIEEIEI